MDAPYFPFYPADWLSDPNVQFLSLEESGAYITLLAYMWRDGKDCSLRDDDQYLSRLLHVSLRKWRKIREILIDGEHAVFAKTSDGLIRNKRLDREYTRMVDKSKKRSNAANSRWEKEKSNDATDVHSQSKSNANAYRLHVQRDAISDSDSDPKSDPDIDSKQQHQDPPLPLDEYAKRVDQAMIAWGNKSPTFGVSGESFDFVKKFHVSGVPIQFVEQCIKEAFESKPDIGTFSYIAKQIKDKWARVLASAQSTEPIDFKTEADAIRSRTQNRAGPQDERYANFYQLFPDG